MKMTHFGISINYCKTFSICLQKFHHFFKVKFLQLHEMPSCIVKNFAVHFAYGNPRKTRRLNFKHRTL